MVIKIGKKLTQEQVEIRDAQIEKNKQFIVILESNIKEIEPFVIKTENYENVLHSLYISLDKSHSNIMQGEYADYYTKNLEPVHAPLFVDLGFELNDDFIILDTIRKNDLKKDLPKLAVYKSELLVFHKKIKELVDEIYTSNSFILRFEGMEDLFKELYKVANKVWTYPVSMSQKQILHNKQYISPLFLHGLPTIYPFHVELFLEFDPFFKLARLLKNKLKLSKNIVKAINANLPFAELNEKVPQIQNIVKAIDNSTSIGSNNEIGNNNAIGDNAIVEEV